MYKKFSTLAQQITNIGQQFYQRGWVWGTSGNFSAVLQPDPLELVITASGLDKGTLTPDDLLLIDQQTQIVSPSTNNRSAKPSDESLLHIQVVKSCGAGAILHTHSVWTTIFSEHYLPAGGFFIEGYEMLKGLEGVKTHQHREWLPIVPNGQDMVVVASQVAQVLAEHPQAHAFFLSGHGLYTWGKDLKQAQRHVEIIEFLLEVLGRKYSMTWPQ